MYKRILVPLDGSKLSEMSLTYVRQLAEAFGSRVDLIYAVQTHVGVDIPEAITNEAMEDAGTYLQRIADSLPKELQLRCLVKKGYPAEVIVDEAEAESREETLILMATRGYSGITRWMLGSIAHKVVQAAETAVLLVPVGAKSPEGGPVEFRQLIVPLDGSSLAEHILPSVMQFCAALDMQLILVRAYNPIFPGSSIRMHDISDIVRDAAESYVKEKSEELRDLCGKEVRYEVLRGIPAEQITDFAVETQNSMTAMCTHGRHGPGRWLLGSVTEAVIRCSEEPVLVVRGTNAAPDS